jgi:hypothetical protein
MSTDAISINQIHSGGLSRKSKITDGRESMIRARTSRIRHWTVMAVDIPIPMPRILR